MSDNHSNNPADSEREDLEPTLACVGQITREFDNMTSRLRMDNAEIAMLSAELQRLGGSGSRSSSPAGRGDSALASGFQEIEQSLARQKTLGKVLCDAATTFAQELVRWAEHLDEREQQENPAPTSTPLKAHAQPLPTPYPLIKVPGLPSDAVFFLYNGQNIPVPPNTDFVAVYNAGVTNGPLNIGGIKAAIGHFGTFDYQRNRGLGWAGQSASVNYFYPDYTDSSNFAVGVFMAGAGYSWPAVNDIASIYADIESGGKISPDAAAMWQAGWDYGQEIKASRALNPAPFTPEDINPFFPLEHSQ